MSLTSILTNEFVEKIVNEVKKRKYGKVTK